MYHSVNYLFGAKTGRPKPIESKTFRCKDRSAQIVFGQILVRCKDASAQIQLVKIRFGSKKFGYFPMTRLIIDKIVLRFHYITRRNNTDLIIV